MIRNAVYTTPVPRPVLTLARPPSARALRCEGKLRRDAQRALEGGNECNCLVATTESRARLGGVTTDDRLEICYGLLPITHSDVPSHRVWQMIGKCLIWQTRFVRRQIKHRHVAECRMEEL